MKFGRFVALSRAGQGGMAEVWKCWDPKLGRVVAVKILTRGTVQQFVDEARMAARLDHPNIVKVYELGWHRSAPFMVMKFIEGEPLHRRALTPQGAIDLMAKVCDAIDYAHSQGVLHRDLKPANILFDGEPRVIDFGLSSDPRFAGTVGYCDGRSADARGDIFALGSTLRALIPDPDRRTASVIRRATDPNPNRRYSRASHMARDLRRRSLPWKAAAVACLAWFLIPQSERLPADMISVPMRVDSGRE
jgi:serine/threonine-protein kinase